MTKHVLVTISSDAHVLYGVRFLCTFFDLRSDLRVTLLHVCLQRARDMDRNLGRLWETADGDRGSPSVKAQQAITRSRDLLCRHGLPVDEVLIRTCAEQYGKVKDILREGVKGCYDAIILGRRATYALQWLFERPGDETARAVMKDCDGAAPLWICPEPKPGSGNLLLCLDGSENSYRAADHVGFVLADQKRQRITLFHVKTVGEARGVELFGPAEELLRGHGISPSRIARSTARGLSVPSAILKAVETGAYAAVAVGMHGLGHGTAQQASFAGSTTAKLIGTIETASLWCCP